MLRHRLPFCPVWPGELHARATADGNFAGADAEAPPSQNLNRRERAARIRAVGLRAVVIGSPEVRIRNQNDRRAEWSRRCGRDGIEGRRIVAIDLSFFLSAIYAFRLRASALAERHPRAATCG
jgi:hypothetical protein